MNDLSTEKLALLIPVVVIVFTCAIPIASLLFKHLGRRRLLELQHRERITALEKGLPVPPLPDAVWQDPGLSKALVPGRALLKGLIWLFVGVGLLVAFREVDHRGAIFGLIPVGVGLAYLIYYFVEVRRLGPPDQDGPHDPTPPASNHGLASVQTLAP